MERTMTRGESLYSQSRAVEPETTLTNGARPKSQTSRVVLMIFGCFIALQTAFAQFDAGVNIGSGYRWDRNPTTNSPEYKNSSGSILPLLVGIHAMVGSETFRFSLEGYGEYQPFSFDLNQKKGWGSFSYGGLAKISITPNDVTWSSTGEDAWSGFSVGVGYEKTKTELYWRPEEYKDMKRDWFPTYYLYLAKTLHKEYQHQDIFLKGGFGPDKALGFEVGIRQYFNFFTPDY